ncbi:hypothetical protein HOG98_06065 [bacterium]|jgi:DNA polymerase III subunit gamma/tau|nr:hypothetical protein [bacterium]
MTEMKSLFSTKNKSYLIQMIENNQIPNGLIFHGQVGSFVNQAAQFFTRALHCETSKTPCDTCNSCLAHTNNSHPDFIHINEEKTINIEKIRWLKEAVKYGPTSSNHMIILIENAQTMTPGSANAFLKLLEEPVTGVTFILIAPSIDMLMPTIISRCQHLFFPQSSSDKINTYVNLLDDASSIKEQCLENIDLLSQYLDTKILPPMDTYRSIADILKMDAFDRISYAQSIPDKQLATLFCKLWLKDIWGTHNKEEKTWILRAEKLIEIILNLKYNLNLKLQMEGLLLSL